MGGCGEAGQHAAADAVDAHTGTKGARCTRGARLYLQPVKTTEYVCDVHVGSAACDEYRVRLRERRPPVIELRRRGVDCILPVA